MARLYLFAEGQTEQTFADTVLKPHLAHFGVYLHNPVLIAHARRKGIVHRGGGRKYEPMKNDIVRFLKQERDADVFFTTMIDLYGIHSGIPGREQWEKYRDDPVKRVQFLQEEFAKDIADPRFIPFIQLHEFEAILFADPATVTRVSLVQGPLPFVPARRTAPAPRALSAAEEGTLDRQLQDIGDPQLRDALGRLGRSLLTRDRGRD